MKQQDGTEVQDSSTNTAAKKVREGVSLPSPKRKQNPSPQLLGTKIETALTTVGITSDRVSKWLGNPCGCKERRDKLNALDAWTRRVLRGKLDRAKEHLEGIMKTQ